MKTAKQRMLEIIQDQREDTTYDELPSSPENLAPQSKGSALTSSADFRRSKPRIRLSIYALDATAP
jgi:hypothetical protein